MNPQILPSPACRSRRLVGFGFCLLAWALFPGWALLKAQETAETEPPTPPPHPLEVLSQTYGAEFAPAVTAALLLLAENQELPPSSTEARTAALRARLDKLAEPERTALVHRLENSIVIRRALADAAKAKQEALIACIDDGSVLSQAALAGLAGAGFYAGDRKTEDIVAAISPEQFEAALTAVAFALAAAPESTYSGIVNDLSLRIKLAHPR